MKFAAEKENSCSVVFEVIEATGSTFNGLNFTVKAFARGIGDSMINVTQQASQVLHELTAQAQELKLGY